jgi:hypothetical protein
MFDLTEPMAQNCLREVCARKAFVKATISRLSPSCVPVPCPSTYPIESGLMSALRSVSPMRLAVEFGFGAE